MVNWKGDHHHHHHHHHHSSADEGRYVEDNRLGPVQVLSQLRLEVVRNTTKHLRV